MGKRSKLWYILPLFFGLGGGTTAWFMLKFGILVKKESGKFFSFTDFPFRLWVLGVIVSVIFWTLQIVEFGLAQRAQQQLPDIILDTIPVYSLLT